MIDRFAPVLGKLPPERAEAIRASATVLQARSGRTLVSLGDLSNSVYLVLQGRAQANVVSMSGREVILNDLDEGDFFGELAAIDDQPRSATVVAMTDCVLAIIPGEAFRRAVTEIPAAALWLAQRLTGQIRNLTEKVFELNALRVRSRLHCELFRMCRHAPGEIVVIDPAPTHAELASKIGTHREAITREISQLIDAGILEQQRRRMTIRDVHALGELVQSATGFDVEMLPRDTIRRPA
ncbi:MAG: Crp/Fnr family transcriptional regulator [Allosphingosinicella sp.]